MPLVLPTQQYHNLPHLPTPPNYTFQSGGSGWRKRSDRVNPSVNTGGWADSLRTGLPTPPSDMTGVSFNTAVSSNYGGVKSQNGYHHSYPSNSLFLNNTKVNALAQAMMPSTQHSYNPNHNANTTLSVPKPVPQREMSDQKSNGSIASYLQIPSSINDSKGSLAEFAAQVRTAFA
jgi:hypothetical protein